MPRSADWMNRSCAIVRPLTRMVVVVALLAGELARDLVEPVLGGLDREPQALALLDLRTSAARPRSASIDIGSRSAPRLSFVVLMVFSLVLESYWATTLRAAARLALGRLASSWAPPGGDLLVAAAWTSASSRSSVRPTPASLVWRVFDQLELLLGHGPIELDLLVGLILELLAQEHQGVGVGLDADLDRAGRLVGVDVVERRVGLTGRRDHAVDQARRSARRGRT